MKLSWIKYLLMIVLFAYNGNLLLAQEDDEYYDDDEYYEEDAVTPNWKYLFVDLGYGSSGPGFGMGFRYWHLGASFCVTGFANDIPKIAVNYNTSVTDLSPKYYPSTVVCGDLWGFYDLEKFSLFVNVGYFSSIDSSRVQDPVTGGYYPGNPAFRSNSGLTFGGGIQAPLTFLSSENKSFNQLVGGLGYHSQIGIFLRVAYRWD